MMKSISISVPGKLMILGEHSVVYGDPCIVSSVDRYVTVSVSASDRDTCVTPGTSDHRFLESALRVCRKYIPDVGAIHIEVHSDLGTYGLGSSSAVTVGCCEGVLQHAGIRYTKKKLFDLAYEAVLRVQGVASGFDVASAIWRGTICFDGKTKKVEEISHKPLPFVVGYSGEKVDTVLLVKRVKQKREKETSYVDIIFSDINDLVVQGIHAIKQEDWNVLGSCMNTHHALLQRLEVSSKKLDDMVSSCLSAGAYGAKLSGAGGGDCMIAVVEGAARKDVEKAIRKHGGEVLDLRLGGAI